MCGQERHPNILPTAATAEMFTVAGHATLTLKSIASGTHYTYRISKADTADESSPWFVSVRVGGDDAFAYAGLLTQADDGMYGFRTTAKSKMTIDAPAVKAWVWFVGHVLNRNTIPAQLEVWHEGTCGRCGRQLTHPHSIELGIGPECASKMGLE